MGMFDSIRCEVPLPDGLVPRELQTKDLDCQCDLYTITADGRLMRHPWKSPDPDLVDIEFHGTLNFYGGEVIGYDGDLRFGPRGRAIERWHEYNAKFTDGRLVEIVCVPDEAATG